MKIVDNEHFIWAEKYRPQCIDDIIIPQNMKDKFKKYIKDERFPHILLSSVNPGLGKTSLTNALIKELDADVLWINGSGENGINIIRDKVTDFVSSVAIDDSPKIVVIDESDGLTKDAQKILRGKIEEFSKDSTFILTCNYKEQLIEPLRNRFIHFDFDNIYNTNKKELGLQIFNRLQFILDNEGIKYNKGILSSVVTSLYPSVRKMVLTIQQNIEDGELKLNSNTLDLNSKYSEILKNIKEKKFDVVRNIVSEIDDPASLYTYVFKNLDEYFVPQSIPRVVIACAKYADMSVNARDKVICASAFTVELMLTDDIKFL